MMWRSILGGAAGVVALAAAGAAGADTIVIEDVIWERGYKLLNPVTSGQYSVFQDGIGAESTWQTYAIEVERNGDMVDFRIYTNKGSNGEGGIAYADFFIDLDPDDSILGPFDNWNLGLDMQTGNLYELNGESSWKTSQQILGATPGVIYGGLFRAAECGASNTGDGDPAACGSIPDGTGAGTVLGFAAATQIQTDASTYLEHIDIGIDSAINDPYGAQHVISFSIAASLLNGGGNFDVLWGTGECANDVIWGNVGDTPSVPEPLSLSLFGLGLAGAFYGVRRRRRAAAA